MSLFFYLLLPRHLYKTKMSLFFYLLPPRHLYKRIYFNPGLGGGPPGADLITREQSMEQ